MPINKKNNTTTNDAEKPKLQHGTVTFRSVNNEKDPKFLGFASIVYHGLILTNIGVRAVERNGEEFAMLSFPSRPRMKSENGKQIPVLDENGKQIYDCYYNPITREAREELTSWVEEAINQSMEQK